MTLVMTGSIDAFEFIGLNLRFHEFMLSGIVIQYLIDQNQHWN